MRIQNIIATFALGLALSTGAQAGSSLLSQGTFVTITVGDEVYGTASIVENEDGSRVLVLEDDFAAAHGPDLQVVLHEEVVPGSYTPENYFNAGELKHFEGYQTYALPDDLDLARFKAVVIWCKEFDVNFGSAELHDVQ